MNEAISALKPIYETRHAQVEQLTLDDLLDQTLKTNPPKLLRDQKVPKVFGLSQVETNPPLFELFVNHPGAISEQYRKYLQKRIMKNLNLWGTPVGLHLRGKDNT